MANLLDYRLVPQTHYGLCGGDHTLHSPFQVPPPIMRGAHSTHSDHPLPQRKVYLPIEKIEKCAVCGGTNTLRLCSACGERVYCSPACQKADWKEHKVQCGKTDHVNLSQFYPLLAYINDVFTIYSGKPVHRAVRHQIINSPNPGSGPIIEIQRGKPAAKLVVLGEEIPENMMGQPIWWPNAMTPPVQNKMFRRITRQGFVLQRILSICLGMLATIYTTTSGPPGPDGKQSRRTRLQYHSSGISDFGICKGVADVKPQDRLVFYYTTTDELELGQEPEDHYWIYFTTFKGEELALDCNMFPFNFCLMADCGHCAGPDMPPVGPMLPAYFRDREHNTYAPRLWDVKKRFSVLRNKSLHAAIANCSNSLTMKDQDAIIDFMEKVAERESTEVEQKLMMEYTGMSILLLDKRIKSRAWINWPAEPQIGIEEDPEGTDPDPPQIDEFIDYMKKWNKKYYKGKITLEQLEGAKKKWEAKHGSLAARVWIPEKTEQKSVLL